MLGALLPYLWLFCLFQSVSRLASDESAARISVDQGSTRY
jgi:hypothetical protein